jgi:hypothetical protein
MMAEPEARAKATYVAPSHMAWMAFALGDTDAAFAYLDRACQMRSSGMTFMLTAPAYDKVRADPRFVALQKLKLPTERQLVPVE